MEGDRYSHTEMHSNELTTPCTRDGTNTKYFFRLVVVKDTWF